MFRRPKRHPLKTARFVRDSDSDEETSKEKADECVRLKQENALSTHEVVETVKSWQNIRKRPAGISAESLFVGRKVDPVISVDNDPFKMKTGGLVDMRKAFHKPIGDEFEDEVRLSKTFAAETNNRDEDADMLKYIEEELSKRKGIAQKTPDSARTPSDGLLAEIPENLKPAVGKQSEDMLSNQMLCGIPEVDLGVEAKMRNIEATEEAKQSLLNDRFTRRRQNLANDLAPTNMSVNFVQHSRWKHYVDPIVLKELSSQLNDAPNSSNQSDEIIIPSLADPPALEAERRRLQMEKSTDALAVQRFKNYMMNKKPRL